MNVKKLPKHFLLFPRNQKNKIISLSYDVNDHVYPNQNLLTSKLIKSSNQ